MRDITSPSLDSISKTVPSTILIFNSSPRVFQRSAASTAIGPSLKSQFIHPPQSLPLIRVRSFASRRGRMPPKKKEEEKKILLGRPGNSLKSGIVCRTPLNPLVKISAVRLTKFSSGRISQCWKVDSFPGDYKVLARKSSGEWTCLHNAQLPRLIHLC